MNATPPTKAPLGPGHTPRTRRWRAASKPGRGAGCTPRSRPRTRSPTSHWCLRRRTARAAARCAQVGRRSRCSRCVPTARRPSPAMGVTERRSIGVPVRLLALIRVSVRPAGTARRRCPKGPRAGSACRRGLPRCRCGTCAPASRRRATSASMSSTMKWMRFQPPGPGLAPSGIGRPAELAGPASSSRRLPRLTSANAGAALRQHLEAEQLGVEGDRLVDVVDHVADIDCLIVRHGLTSSVAGSSNRWSRNPMRVSSSARGAFERGQGGPVVRRPRAPGRGCSSGRAPGATGTPGQTSRTRSHSVITRSKRCATNSSRCLVRFALMSIPRFLMTRTALGCSGFGWLPADAASTAPSDIVLEQRLRDLRARAVPGAQEQDPRPATPGVLGAASWSERRRRATDRDAARRPRLAAASRQPARSMA